MAGHSDPLFTTCPKGNGSMDPSDIDNRANVNSEKGPSVKLLAQKFSVSLHF